MEVRTRFAPSPTGYLHVGAFRTALFAWLLARQNNGQFILRLEDTDQSREVAGADKHIIRCLNALGLSYDEGPEIGGMHAPYRQSERLDIYKKWAEKLIESGRAYVDPYSPEEVQGFREQAQKDKRAFLYRTHRPEKLDTNWDGTKPLRFKSDPDYLAHFTSEGPVVDEVMGELKINEDTVDDFILVKSDGFPTYNFAHIVDDAEMEISHVIRGQEFLSSMPNYLDLYNALGISRPKFAHLPHILNVAGNKKLSKRDGAKDILEYVEEGIPNEAFINFVASLGWNDGTEQEIFNVDELIERFSLPRVQRSGARFDEKRLLWTSGAHIRRMEIDTLCKAVENYWPASSADYDESYRQKVLVLVQERLKFYKELPDLTDFFFVDLPVDDSLIGGHKQLKKLEKSDLQDLLSQSKESLVSIHDWQSTNIQECLNALLEKTMQKPAVLFSLIRIATTQSPASPGLAETLELLGKERVITRLNEQLQAFA